jgi:NAD+ kinase
VTVGLVVKRHKPEAESLALRLEALLGARGVETTRQPKTPVDLVVVLGGDGTFLHAAHVWGERGVPLVGVNLGGMGMLTSFTPDEMEDGVLRALDGALPVERRMRLRATMYAGGQTATYVAVNDAVVSQGAIARMLDLETLLDGARVALYKADGLIVATPTGSTAYTLAAGGPVLTPDLRAMVITPICPHALTHRTVVVPAESVLRIRAVGEQEHVFLTIDGQRGQQLPAGAEVEVRADERPLLCLRNPARPFFETLRSKLKWGYREA